ncbi:MAG: cytochrome c maturation protein CcmE [Acidimicrobiia bacterium]|nr:cytochrome c maturation protein CcmE [Acidimicrobiia bacterium]MBT8214760.1 cytochrome c maturation protein CcmE [Acidimicrobiia bacterium]NNF68561.1 cytochrome c maturation protein CcmE [Acidimicrobiia bacterium]NNK91250.1 cytochrome c maturation protein CcmE [Acidimicrobiia bacterium]
MPHKSFLIPTIGLVILALGYIVFGGLNDNLVYYLTPAEAVERRVDYADGDRFRLGGFVEVGSVTETTNGVVFTVVDEGVSVDVEHTGSPPQLFRDNIGVVVEGAWAGDVFETDTLIIKHDEEYRSTDGEEPYVPPAESEG